MPNKMYLLNPEWQGYGENNKVYFGAIELAELIFQGKEIFKIDTPAEEYLKVVDKVLGLHSIVPRFKNTMKILREKSPDKIFMVGGTCGTEAAPVAYLNERYNGNLTVIWFDAHGDLNTPESSDSTHFHGMVLRTLLGEGPEALVRKINSPLSTKQVILAGCRDLDDAEEKFIAETHITLVSKSQLENPGTFKKLLKSDKRRNIYIHIDLDVFNPSVYPRALVPVPGGVSILKIRDILEELYADHNIVGLSIVENCELAEAKLYEIVDLAKIFL